MTTGGLLVSISTPYRRLGLLHSMHRDHYGIDMLVVQGASTVLNPTLTAEHVGAIRAGDPEGASAEVDAEFRSDRLDGIASCPAGP